MATLIRYEREKCAVLRVVQQWSTGFSAEVDVLQWVVGQKIVLNFGEGHKVCCSGVTLSALQGAAQSSHASLASAMGDAAPSANRVAGEQAHRAVERRVQVAARAAPRPPQARRTHRRSEAAQ
eukprot:4724826-Prymnesium_polylepis.1